MSNKSFAIGQALTPPSVDAEIITKMWGFCSEICDSREFSVTEWNSILFMLIMYKDKHDESIPDKEWPWAEEVYQ